MADGRSRRVDRLLGRLPDRRRQGRGLVRGRRLRPKRSRRTAPGLWAEGARAQPRARAAGRRRARRPYRHRPCRRRRRRSIGAEPKSAIRIARRRSTRRAALGPISPPKGSIALDGVSLTVNEVEPMPATATALHASTSSPTPPQQTTLRRHRGRADSSTSRSTCWPAISSRMIDARSQYERDFATCRSHCRCDIGAP